MANLHGGITNPPPALSAAGDCEVLSSRQHHTTFGSGGVSERIGMMAKISLSAHRLRPKSAITFRLELARMWLKPGGVQA
jgi:hypothetical protein